MQKINFYFFFFHIYIFLQVLIETAVCYGVAYGDMLLQILHFPQLRKHSWWTLATEVTSCLVSLLWQLSGHNGNELAKRWKSTENAPICLINTEWRREHIMRGNAAICNLIIAIFLWHCNKAPRTNGLRLHYVIIRACFSCKQTRHPLIYLSPGSVWIIALLKVTSVYTRYFTNIATRLNYSSIYS